MVENIPNSGKVYKKEIYIATNPDIELGVRWWLSEHFAPRWFADAFNEMQSNKSLDSLRREIIFAVCFSESYLFEWTRLIVGVESILNYFPLNDRRGHIPKWKNTLKKLYENGKIAFEPALAYDELEILVKYRNGFIHAHASRPMSNVLAEQYKPSPSRQEIERLTPGWALKIVVNLIRALHKALRTTEESYITSSFPNP